MQPIHRIVVALVLAVAAVAGLAALTRTLDLGAAGTGPARTADALVAHRRHRIGLVERSLRRALQRRPPALPRVPRFADPSPAAPAAAQPAPSARRVIYVRPPPHVVTIHRAGGGEPGEGGEGPEEGGGDD